MAVYQFYKKCDVCSEVTLIRVQAGHLTEHPVRIHCGGCETLFTGNVLFNEEIATIILNINNCTSINKVEKYDYAIEVSGELPTMKLYTYKDFQNSGYVLTPFMRLLSIFDHEKHSNFGSLIPFLRSISERWPLIRRINELFFNEKWILLEKELKKYVFNKRIVLLSEIDFLMAVHQFTINFLVPPLSPLGFFDDTQISRKVNKLHLDYMTTISSEELSEYNQYLESMDLKQLQVKIFKIIDMFIEKFKYIIPGFTLLYMEVRPDDDKLGITTVTLDDLKVLYVDSFETLMDLLGLLIVYNNIAHRSSFSIMKILRRDITDINQFEKLSNGKKIEFINGDETFDKLVYSKYDHQLRNAIGHASTQYDSKNQMITYFPKGTGKSEPAQTIYLIDFIKKCIDQFSALMNTSELLYHVQKIQHIQNGQQPTGVNVAEEKSNNTGTQNILHNLNSRKK